MIRKVIKMEFVERGSKYFHEPHVWVYLEGSCHIPSYGVSAKQLEVMAFGC